MNRLYIWACLSRKTEGWALRRLSNLRKQGANSPSGHAGNR